MADITRLRPEEQAVVDAFHRLYYPFFGDTRWMGVEAQKCPIDLFVYQELVFELKPDLIIRMRDGKRRLRNFSGINLSARRTWRGGEY